MSDAMSRALFPPSWGLDSEELPCAADAQESADLQSSANQQGADHSAPSLCAQFDEAKRRQFEANLAAVRSLSEGPPEALVHYVGWTDPDVRSLGFDAVGTPKRELIEACAASGIDPTSLVSPAGLSAYQTPGRVSGVVWEVALRALGRVPRSVLEPAAGMGSFLAAAPSEIAGLAVEPDPVMGRILFQRFPAWRPRVMGLEQAGLVAPSFDLAVGFLPFGEWGVRDAECCASLRRQGIQHRVADWMLCRVASLLVAGGVAAVLVDSSVLDREVSPAREWLFAGADPRVELVGAWRLPSLWGVLGPVVDLVVVRRTGAML